MTAATTGSVTVEPEPALAGAPPAEPSTLVRPNPFALAPRPGDKPAPPMPMEHVPPRRSRALLAAWVGSVAVLVVAAVLAVVLREPISRAWPPSLRVYEAVGLADAG